MSLKYSLYLALSIITLATICLVAVDLPITGVLVSGISIWIACGWIFAVFLGNLSAIGKGVE